MRKKFTSIYNCSYAVFLYTLMRNSKNVTNKYELIVWIDGSNNFSNFIYLFLNFFEGCKILNVFARLYSVTGSALLYACPTISSFPRCAIRWTFIAIWFFVLCVRLLSIIRVWQWLSVYQLTCVTSHSVIDGVRQRRRCEQFNHLCRSCIITI